ncbi:DUF2147 domain-containing protein [Piscinibacter sp. Jin2]|uniref:DUF2147 domain-containing protein n=1 Tax=Aquariibacter lacus TaxID=2801332 RepID=A0A9X0XBW2_9BURK|nr:DUF2147 domain-containing protein [Piscinibacter lacus]MBL0718784.1 DUF2147 domain-containing protein [Piscinibacter lacus]
MIRPLMASLALLAFSGLAAAQSTPVGLWKSIDDKTGKERSLVRLAETGGLLVGRIEKRLDPTAKPDAVCGKCSDDRKDKPMDGLEIIRGVQAAGDGKVWTGGQILDPEEGKTYQVKLTPVEGGSKLEVRGFIGFSLLGRTQTWLRVE